MPSNNQSVLFARGFLLIALAIFMLVLYPGCASGTTYSIEEERQLWATRSNQMSNQLKFSFSFTPDHVSVGQDIFFVAIFTNTTAQPLMFREPKGYGIMEATYPDTTLLFAVEPIQADIQFKYPLDTAPHYLRDLHPTERSEFVALPAHNKREIRLELRHLVFREGTQDLIPLPPGQYLVKMTYINYYIGYEVQRNRETRYVDLGAWVGQMESSAALLTITP